MFSDFVAHARDEIEQAKAYIAEVEEERNKVVKRADELTGRLEAARAELDCLAEALAVLQKALPTSENPPQAERVREHINQVLAPYQPQR